MELLDATEQYVDAVKLGLHAVQRLARRELDGPQCVYLDEIVEEIIRLTDQLRSAVPDTP